MGATTALRNFWIIPYRKTAQRAIVVKSWSVSKQGNRPTLSCPVLMMMMNTWQTTATVTCICHYRGSPGHWPVATGDWVTRLHNIIIISVAALHLSISSTPGQGCFVQAGADLSIVVNCPNSLFFVHLKYCAGHQRGSERGNDGKMFTDKIQIKYSPSFSGCYSQTICSSNHLNQNYQHSEPGTSRQNCKSFTMCWQMIKI